MSTSTNSDDPDDLAPPPSTIEERIAAGRAGLHPAHGGILPFPRDISPQFLDRIFAGSERHRYSSWYQAGYRPTLFKYRSATGELINAVLRLDHREFPATHPKILRPLTYFGNFEGKGDIYGLISIQRPWPLFGLDRLAARPDAPVLVTEGEKACDAAGKLFPDHVAITWMSGASNVRHAEMLPLSGRKLVLWPDNDPPGRAAMRNFAARAYEAGAVSVSMIDVPSEFGPKWDLADPIPAECLDAYSVEALLASARLMNPSEVTHLTEDARN